MLGKKRKKEEKGKSKCRANLKQQSVAGVMSFLEEDCGSVSDGLNSELLEA